MRLLTNEEIPEEAYSMNRQQVGAVSKAQDVKTLRAVGRAMGNLDLTDRDACSKFMQTLQRGEMPE